MATSGGFVKFCIIVLVVGSICTSFRLLSMEDSRDMLVSTMSTSASVLHQRDGNDTVTLSREIERLHQQLDQLYQLQRNHQSNHEELQRMMQSHHEELKRSLASATVLRGTAVDVNVTIADDTPPATATVLDAEFGDLSELYQRFQYEPPRAHTTDDGGEAICGVAPDYAKFFDGSQHIDRSVNNEDAVIFNTFFKKLDEVEPGHVPTYLELGAYNGKRESNTRFFDLCLGWNGLLVEANPHEKVSQELTKNRPTAHRMHFAASCSHHTAVHDRETVPFYPVMWTNAAQETGKNNTPYTGIKTPVDVPCGSLTPFIQDLLGGRITFMSLDVEGAEPNVLEHVDFGKIRVDVMIVEKNNQMCKSICESRDRFRAILDKAGYVRPSKQFVQKSDLYVHPESPFAKLVM